jgi:WbqC-like protein family
MKVGIMQPYFLPYIGYFQLIHAVDVFVLYDNIEYTKKGWINRNRILVNGKDEYITLPLKKDSDYLHIDKRSLTDTFVDEKIKTLRKIAACYRKAPFFNEGYALIERIYACSDTNLYSFIENSIRQVCAYLDIKTTLVVASEQNIDHLLRSEEKVLALCKQLGAKTYINPIGGVELYKRKRFMKEQIDLNFLRPNPFVYSQFQHDFVPWLSIMDVIMFNSREAIMKQLNDGYELITN